MSTLPELYTALLRLNLRYTIPDIIRSTAPAIVELNKEQLKSGLTSKGNKIEPQYATTLYALEKQNQNPLPGFSTPDLFVTGAFYSGFYFAVSGNKYTAGSTDSKSSALENKYTSDIFGLNDTSRQTYVEQTLFPAIAARVKAETGLDMR